MSIRYTTKKLIGDKSLGILEYYVSTYRPYLLTGYGGPMVNFIDKN